jgi:protein phosphatase
MGGHQAGEVASAIAVQMLRDRLGQGAANVEAAIAAVVDANTAIFTGARDNAEQRGMGTTLTALVVLADGQPGDSTRRFVLLNVGDSRTYLLRGGRLRRVTVDHSYVQELLSTGNISELEARSHPRRNIVTRALGIDATVRVDTWVLPFVKGDRFLLCSDGLVDEVDDDDIGEAMAAHRDPQRAAQALVDLANEHGGRDNTTVVVVDVLEGDVVADDTADLDLDLVWIDQPPGARMDVDAEASTSARDVITAEIPITQSGNSTQRKRFGFGSILFWFGIAAIVAGAVTLVLVVRNNAGDDPEPAPTTTVVATTTTIPRTTTTRPATTTIAVTTTTGG